MKHHTIILNLFLILACLDYCKSENCKTTEGLQCQFPFRYNFKTYSSCTSVENNGIDWCPTDFHNDTLQARNWGNCSESCPIEDSIAGSIIQFSVYDSKDEQTCYYNFTKQISTFEDRPFYYSLGIDVLWWSNEKSNWLGQTYDEELRKFVPIFQIKKNFSHLDFPENHDWTILQKTNDIVIKSRYLTYDSKCLGVREDSNEIPYNKTYLAPIKATAKSPCVFPFKYEGKLYNSCTNVDADGCWCATSVNSDLDFEWTNWGFCSESCPIEGTYN